jgi:hypothetical protein
MFHHKLLINLAPLSIADQIDWHAPKVMIIQSGGALPNLGEKLEIRSAQPLPLALITVSSASIFNIDTGLACPVGPQSFDWKLTAVVNMENNNTILKVNLEDLPDDQKVLIEQATEEFKEKCLLSYSRTHESVVQKTSLPRVLLHG